MRARSRARPSDSPSETQAIPYSSKDSLLLSTSSSQDSEAPSFPQQSQHLPAGMAHMHTAGIARNTSASWQDPADPPGPFYPGLICIPKRSQWLQRVWSLLAELRASDFTASVAVAVTSSLLLFTLPFLQLMQKGQHSSPAVHRAIQEGDGEQKASGIRRKSGIALKWLSEGQAHFCFYGHEN